MLVVLGGVLLGVAYTLSPLSVLSLGLLAWASIAAGRNLSTRERRWYWSIMSVSVLVRLIAIALLFYTADPARPFASFFGDEELYKFRTIWLRNIGQGLPMSPADVIYSFDDVGHTSYIYVLAYIQALVGDAPYGLHVMNMALYFCGVLGLYRLARASYGRAVGMAGLILLLFIPSVALWSISVLKEPMNVLMIAAELTAAVMIVRAPRWWQRLIAAMVVIAGGAAMESLRTGGMITAIFGTVIGIAMAWIVSQGRRVIIAVIAVPVAVALLVSLPPIRQRVLTRVREAALYHAGHVLTPGYSYQLVDRGYYTNRERFYQMPAIDAGRYAVKALWAYATQPLPRENWSRSLLAYMPEQVVWWVIALLLPWGFIAALKRDAVVTCLLAAHAMAAIAIIALSSGNIGTLIRHRSLALLYVIWLSAVGAHECMRVVIPGQRSGVNGDR
jgi:hypothetical protein